MLSELAASAALEVNQPLSAIAANAQAGRRRLARRQPEIAAAMTAIDGIVRASDRASQVVRRIRAMARRAEPAHVTLDLKALVRDTPGAHGRRAAPVTHRVRPRRGGTGLYPGMMPRALGGE